MVANGYYEWKGDKGKKQPYYIRPIGTDLIAFAGLWDTWEGPGGELNTFTIIVTEANETTQQIHNRMPVILDHNNYDQWLGKGGTKLLAPYRDDGLECYKVSTLVNKPKNEGGKLIKPL